MSPDSQNPCPQFISLPSARVSVPCLRMQGRIPGQTPASVHIVTRQKQLPRKVVRQASCLQHACPHNMRCCRRVTGTQMPRSYSPGSHSTCMCATSLTEIRQPHHANLHIPVMCAAPSFAGERAGSSLPSLKDIAIVPIAASTLQQHDT